MRKLFTDQRGFLDPVTIGVLGGLALFAGIAFIYNYTGEVRLW